MEASTMHDLMNALDCSSNMFGELSPEVRARLFAVVSDPTQETWEDAHCLIISREPWSTLWQAVEAHTDYHVTSKPMDGPWPCVPTTDQLVAALTAYRHASCEYELDGHDTDGTPWYRCGTHDRLEISMEVPCEGWVNPAL